MERRNGFSTLAAILVRLGLPLLLATAYAGAIWSVYPDWLAASLVWLSSFVLTSLGLGICAMAADAEPAT